jgi:hypothetical protein
MHVLDFLDFRQEIIELDQGVGVPDGQKVEVAINIIRTGPGAEAWGEGLRRCAGALAGIPGLDEDMEPILAARKKAKFREVPEWVHNPRASVRKIRIVRREGGRDVGRSGGPQRTRRRVRRDEEITFTNLALVNMAKEVKLVDGISRLILPGANKAWTEGLNRRLEQKGTKVTKNESWG